jgi:hypothetical protein
VQGVVVPVLSEDASLEFGKGRETMRDFAEVMVVVFAVVYPVDFQGDHRRVSVKVI